MPGHTITNHMTIRLLAFLALALGACTAAPTPGAPSSPPRSQTALVAASPTVAPASARPVSEVPPCRANALGAVAGWQGAGGSMAGNIVVYNIGWATCRLSGTPGLEVMRTSGERLNVTVSGDKAAVGDTFGGQVLVQGASARAFLVWMNWCGVHDTALDLRLTLPETGEMIGAHVLDMSSESSPATSYPRCDAAGSPSQLSVDPFQAR